MTDINCTKRRSVISRRRFVAICQFAAVPALLSTAGILGDVANRALGHFPSLGNDDALTDSPLDVGVTSLVTTAILRSGRKLNDPVVVRSLKSIEAAVHFDGGIYSSHSRHENYETCLAVMCLVEANAGGRYDRILLGAEQYLKRSQWAENNGQKTSDPALGGVACGSRMQPDLASTAFFLDAMRSCKVATSDPAVQKALAFVSRCQNIAGANRGTAATSFVHFDGGFCDPCAPIGGIRLVGWSAHGITPSSGSMTCCGLIGLLSAGVTPNDPRRKAAVAWMQKHYTAAGNPGLGRAEYYYYLYACAKALDALGMDAVEDSVGRRHDWRSEILEELLSRQRSDGSWANDCRCGLESDPTIATAYALLAISYCKTSTAKKNPAVLANTIEC